MPLTIEQRGEIVAVAESWYSTPYRGWTRIKGVGCDCGQFLAAVYEEAGHIADVVIPDGYSLHLTRHRKSTMFTDLVEKFMREIPEVEVQPGDTVVYKLAKGFTHGAIIKAWPKHIIHALTHAGVCAGDGMNFRYGHLEKKFFTLKDEFCKTEGFGRSFGQSFCEVAK